MNNDDEPYIPTPQPSRQEGQRKLRAWATPEQLDRGLEAALEVFLACGVAPGRAAVCSIAVSAY